MGNAIELGSCLYALVGACVVAWGIWRAWVKPNDQTVVDLAERRQPTGWSVRGELARLFLVSAAPVDMSSSAPDRPTEQTGDRRAWHRVPEPGFASATPNTEDTAPVPGAAGAAGASAIDTSARDIIRASVIAELLDSGLLTNRDKAICQAFRCSKASSSRPDAPFQVALKLVEQHRTKARPEFVGDMIARVEREVAAEQKDLR